MSETQELNALCEKIPPTTAVQLRALALQAHVARQMHPGLFDDATPPPRPNNVTLQAFWWGFHFAIPTPFIAALEGDGVAAFALASSIRSSAGPAAPFVPLADAYVATELALIRAVDRGRGVHLSMAWLAPGIFVSTAI
jgi:hypothetical protein